MSFLSRDTIDSVLDIVQAEVDRASLGVSAVVCRADRIYTERSSFIPVWINVETDDPLFDTADGSKYSWLDFCYVPEEKTLTGPWIKLQPHLRNGHVALALLSVMDTVGRKLDCTHIEAYNIINDKLSRGMPIMGYVPFPESNHRNAWRKPLVSN